MTILKPEEFKFQVNDTVQTRTKKLEDLRHSLSKIETISNGSFLYILSDQLQKPGKWLPVDVPPLTIGKLITVEGAGRVLQYDVNTLLATRDWQPLQQGSILLSAFTARVTKDDPVAAGLGYHAQLSIGFLAYAQDGHYLGAFGEQVKDADWTVADGWKTYETSSTAEALLTAYPTAYYVRSFIARDGDTAIITQISSARIENSLDMADISGAVAAAEAAAASAVAAAIGAESANTTAAGYASISESYASVATGEAAASHAEAVAAQSYAQDSDNYAQASASSATTAQTYSTAAGSSAAAAEVSRLDAVAAAGTATSQADIATTKAVEASGSASAALVSQVLSSSYSNTRGLTPNGMFDVGTVGASVAPGWTLGSGNFFYATTPYGTAVYSGPGLSSGIGSTEFIEVDTARKYALHSHCVITVAPQITYAGMQCFDGAGNFLGNVYTTSSNGIAKADGYGYDLSDTFTGIYTPPGSPPWYNGGLKAFYPGTVRVKLLFLANYGAAAGGITYLQDLYLEDITESSAANTYATASQTYATNASASAASASSSESLSATYAGNSATSASGAAGSAGAAADSAATALAQADIATTQATNASASAASAATSTVISASITNNILNPNPNFVDYTNTDNFGPPGSWSIWEYGVQQQRNTGTDTQPYSVRMVSGAGNNVGLSYISPQGSLNGKDYVVLLMSIRYLGTTLAPTGMLVYYFDSSSNLVGQTTLTALGDNTTSGTPLSGTPAVGQILSYTKLDRVPAGASFYRIYAMGAWSSYGSVAASVSVDYLLCGIRKAYDQEIAAKAATSALVTANANIATNAAAIASTNSALASSNTTLTASIADNTASISENASAIATLNGYTESRLVFTALAGGRAQLTLYSNSNGGGGVDIVGDVSISGNLVVDGTIIASDKVTPGTITTPTIAANAISVKYFQQLTSDLYIPAYGTVNAFTQTVTKQEAGSDITLNFDVRFYSPDDIDCYMYIYRGATLIDYYPVKIIGATNSSNTRLLQNLSFIDTGQPAGSIIYYGKLQENAGQFMYAATGSNFRTEETKR